MDSFEVNKIAGGVLGTLLLTMALGLFSGFIYSPPVPTKPGYDLPAAPAEGGGEGQAKSAAPAEPLPVLLAKADIGKGQGFAKACGACHNFEKGAAAKVGPPLYGVVGREVASVPGFSYSDSLKSKGGTWDYEKINAFITSPKAYAPGTKMTFAGESDPDKRADIIDYLHTLSDTPEPLPAVTTPAAATAPAADAPAPAAPNAKAPAGNAPAAPAANPPAAAPVSPEPAAPAAPAAPADPASKG